MDVRLTRDLYDYAKRTGHLLYVPRGKRKRTRFSSLRESDIEHVIAVSEAHDSGLCAASGTLRRRFARDLDNLTLATPDLNRYQKRGYDAAEWLPEHNCCWFAATVVAVRKEYELTIDRREATALDRIISGCDSFELVTPEPSP